MADDTKAITREQLAERLTGRDYGEEMTEEEELLAAESGLIVIYGASDDLIEFRGAINDEIGAFEGRTLYLYRGGIINDPDTEDCVKCRQRLVEARKAADRVQAKRGSDGYSWFIVPHPPLKFSPFTIWDDGLKYCRGVVIEAAELPLIAGV